MDTILDLGVVKQGMLAILATIFIFIICTYALYKLVRPTCFLCGKTEWVCRMKNYWISGSSPETAEFSYICPVCNEDNKRKMRSMWRSPK